MLDRDGYRPNVGIILLNSKNQVFWGKRIRNIPGSFRKAASSPVKRPSRRCSGSCTRKSGCRPEHVQDRRPHARLAALRGAGSLDPTRARGNYRGQKQIWYLLRLVGRDSDVSLRATDHPEFDAWRWHDYWVPLDVVIEFKRDVYQLALTELARFCVQARPRRATEMPRVRSRPHGCGESHARRHECPFETSAQPATRL